MEPDVAGVAAFAGGGFVGGCWDLSVCGGLFWRVVWFCGCERGAWGHGSAPAVGEAESVGEVGVAFDVEEAEVVLFEPAGVRNTGNVVDERFTAPGGVKG